MEDVIRLEPAVVLSYFHRKMGPVVFAVCPSGVLSEGESRGIVGLLDQMGGEGFSTAPMGNVQVSSYFFEMSSPWAGCSRESLLLSIALEERVPPEKETANGMQWYYWCIPGPLFLHHALGLPSHNYMRNAPS